MDADAAVEHVLNVTKDSAITVVGVAGPGDSLANEATFEFFEKINEAKPDLIKKNKCRFLHRYSRHALVPAKDNARYRLPYLPWS